MDSNTTNNGILMRLINNVHIDNICDDYVTVTIIIDINEILLH